MTTYGFGQIYIDDGAEDEYLEKFEADAEEKKPREPGCRCQWEEGDSPCPVHGDSDFLLINGEHERVLSLLGPGEGRRVSPPKLSEEARAARAPRPPEELVGALQDRIHPTSGRLRAAKSVRFRGGR